MAVLLTGLAGRVQGAEADPTIVELGEVKIPASVILKIEKAWLESVKKNRPDMNPTGAQRADLRRRIAGNELDMALMTKAAESAKLTVSADDLNAKLKEFEGQLGRNNMTMDAFLERQGKSLDEFKKIFAANLALEKQQEALVTEKEVQDEFAQHQDDLPMRRCSHILYMYKGSQRSTATRTKEEAQKLAQDTLAKLKAGGDFAALAKEGSDCPSKQQGGDLNFSARKGQMVEEFAAALYKLPKVGDLSDVVETPFGYHVIKLTELKPADEFKKDVKGRLVGERMQKVMQDVRGGKTPTFNEEALKQGLDMAPPAPTMPPLPPAVPGQK